MKYIVCIIALFLLFCYLKKVDSERMTNMYFPECNLNNNYVLSHNNLCNKPEVVDICKRVVNEINHYTNSNDNLISLNNAQINKSNQSVQFAFDCTLTDKDSLYNNEKTTKRAKVFCEVDSCDTDTLNIKYIQYFNEDFGEDIEELDRLNELKKKNFRQQIFKDVDHVHHAQTDLDNWTWDEYGLMNIKNINIEKMPTNFPGNFTSPRNVGYYHWLFNTYSQGEGHSAGDFASH